MSESIPAREEAWWPDFVQSYGQSSLHELARRFNTNRRRLRRAAQRAGLTSEPELLRPHLGRLGTVPDATLAQEIGVSAEIIKGARKRRGIPGFHIGSEPPSVVAKREEKTPSPSEDFVVVRRRAPARRAVVEGSFRPLPLAEPEVEAPKPVKRRRRLVAEPIRIERAAPPKPSRKPRKPAPPPVATIFDRSAEPAVPVTQAPPEPQALPKPAPRPRAPEVYWHLTGPAGEAVVRASSVAEAVRVAGGVYTRVQQIRPL